jgi:hypothetical protein
MKIFKPIIYLFLLSLWVQSGGQTISISGTGSGYKNEELRIFFQTDPVTKRLKPLKRVSCDENGKFSSDLQLTKSGIIFIKSGIYNLQLFVSEGSIYDLLLPDHEARPGIEDQNPFYIETEMIPEVTNNANDINNLIRAFDYDYNPVFNYVADLVAKNFKKATIPNEISKLNKFLKVEGPSFYNDYVKCRMMMLNLVGAPSQYQPIAEDFINSGFSSDNQAYCDLAQQMYTGFFSNISSGQMRDSFNRAIATASFSELKSVILREGKVKNKELADFIILMNLYSEYYSRSLPAENVRKIISIMKAQVESENLKNTAFVILDKLNSSLQGNLLTDFSLSDNDGRVISIKDFHGKYVLLGFARSDNPTSQIELGIINMWQKKYFKDVQVVTILADKNFNASFTVFRNRGFNWIFLDGSKREDLDFVYDLKMYPSFILLDREGKIIADPCSYPSEDLEITINNILLRDPNSSGSQNR